MYCASLCDFGIASSDETCDAPHVCRPRRIITNIELVAISNDDQSLSMSVSSRLKCLHRVASLDHYVRRCAVFQYQRTFQIMVYEPPQEDHSRLVDALGAVVRALAKYQGVRFPPRTPHDANLWKTPLTHLSLSFVTFNPPGTAESVGIGHCSGGDAFVVTIATAFQGHIGSDGATMWSADGSSMLSVADVREGSIPREQRFTTMHGLFLVAFYVSYQGRKCDTCSASDQLE